MRRAALAVPPVADLYPWRALADGLKRIGFDVDVGPKKGLGDVLVTWSPWNFSHRQGLQVAHNKQTRPVIVVENGWLTPLQGKAYYQLGINGWNGTGRIIPWDDDGRRWRSFGARVLPWDRRAGRMALVTGQRGSDTDQRTATKTWHETVTVDLPENLVIRRPRSATSPLLADMARVSECHVWTSNAASTALCMGVPVIQHGPNLMTAELASRPGESLKRGEREPVFWRLAGAQWTAEELATGQPLAKFLEWQKT